MTMSVSENSGREKRRSERVPYLASVQIETENVTIEQCSSQNLSQNGIFVETEASLSVGDECRVTVTLSGTETISLQIKGFVSRVNSQGAGICFTEMDLEAAEYLHNIVYYNM